MKDAELKMRVEASDLQLWKDAAENMGEKFTTWVREGLTELATSDLAVVPKPSKGLLRTTIETQDLGRQIKETVVVGKIPETEITGLVSQVKKAVEKKLQGGRPAHHIRCVCSICNPEKEKK
jgi:hypothetical protein